MRAAAVAVLFLLLTLSASAQSFEQTTYLRLHESSMSPRTTAMGGASDASSTDPTDVAANPALVASLKTTTFSLSAAQTRYGVPRFDNFRGREGRDATSLSHASIAFPLRGAVLAVYYRDEPRLHDREVGPQPGIDPYMPVCVYDPEQGPCRYIASADAVAFNRRDRRYGLAAAMERGALSFGVGLELQDFEQAHDLATFAIPLSIGMERLMRRTSGQDLVPNAGLRWRITPKVAVAAAYNGAGTFDRTDDLCVVDVRNGACTSAYQPVARITVKRPDQYRASVAVLPTSDLTLTAEAVRVNYTNLEDASEWFGYWYYDSRYQNATDLHAGAEYRLGNLALRAGWWREEAKRAADYVVGDRTLQHITVGAGFNLGAARIDLAYDDVDAPSLRRATVGVAWTR